MNILHPERYKNVDHSFNFQCDLLDSEILGWVRAFISVYKGGARDHITAGWR